MRVFTQQLPKSTNKHLLNKGYITGKWLSFFCLLNNRFVVFIVLFCLGFNGWGQIPSNYYDAAAGLSGSALKTKLHDIVSAGHTALSYAGLWTAYNTTDRNPATGKIWDMYSNCDFTYSTSQCGIYAVECDCYNREHSFPKSWFGGNENSTMGTDLNHVVPTDGYVNGRRSNNLFGEVTVPTYTSGNGSKLGPNDIAGSGYTGTVFEPVDEYKGDFARAYFYMATRYIDEIPTWVSSYGATTEVDDLFQATGDFQPWCLNMLYAWHLADPVSQKEIDRNDAVYNAQGNANPYIDHPEWVCEAFIGSCTPIPTLTVTPSTLTGFTYVSGNGPSTNQNYTISGANLTGSGDINITGSVNYEVSTDGVAFSNIVTYPYASGVITGQPKTVYVRLKSGLGIASYNSEIISNAGGDATAVNVTCSGFVTGIPTVTLGDNGTVVAGNIAQNSTAQVLLKVSLAVTNADASLTGLQITTAGSYATADITNLKVRYSVDATLDEADITLSTLSAPGTAGTLTFPDFVTQTINAASTGYVFITADVASGATIGNTIKVNAITTPQLTFSEGTTKSGSSTDGAFQTIIAGATSSVCLTEGFASGLTAPAGWTVNAGGTYSSDPYIGIAAPSIKMSATGNTIETATVTNPIELKFWIYGNGTPTTDKLLVQGWDGSAWKDIDNVTPPTLSEVTKVYNSGSVPALAAGFTKFKFTYTKAAINIGFDDIEVTCESCTEPAITGTSDGSSCGTGTVNLGATASAGTINWYDVATGGVSLGTGTSFTTPSINTTTTYYVDATDKGCTTASRTAVTATVNTPLPVSVSISANPGTTISAGTNVTFTAVPTNGGASPVYQWKVNESNVGTGLSTYSTNTLNNADVVTCEMTSALSCVSDNPATSDALNMTVYESPTIQANNIVFTNIKNNSLDISWVNGNGSNRAVFVKESGGAVTNPENNITYVASSDWSLKGTQLGTSGYYCVYNSNGNTFTLTNLLAGTPYTVQIFEYNGISGVENYLSSVAIDNPNSEQTHQGCTWIGSSSTDWSVNSNWSSGNIPSSTDDVYILSAPLNQPHITALPSTPALCNNITIFSGATLTIDAGKAFTVLGNVVNDGTLNIKANAGGMGNFIDNGSINGLGIFNIERWVSTNNNSRWEYISSPVTSASSSLFTSAFQNLYYADETQNAWASYTHASPQEMTVLKGFARKYVLADADGDDVKKFTGMLNTGIQTIALTRTESAPGVEHGWNLVGNPYPSTIDWDALDGWTKTNLDNAIYFRSNGTYSSYVDGLGIGAATKYIPPMQAFWVRVATGKNAGTLACNNSVRVHNARNTYKSSLVNTLHLYVVNNDNGLTDDMYVRFKQEATDGFDSQYDAYKMFAADANYPQIYTNNGTDNISINSLSELVGERIVPLGFKTSVSGQFAFTADLVTSFTDNGNTVFLEDTLTGMVVDLSKTASYSFTSGITNGINRFRLYFNSAMTGNKVWEQASVWVYSYENNIYINSPQGIGNAEVYDMTGKKIGMQLLNRGMNKLHFTQSKGIYVVKAYVDGEVVLQKVAIE